AELIIRAVQEAARAKGLELHIVKAGTESEIDAAFTSLAQLHTRALFIGPDPFFISRRDQLVALALRHAVPTIYEERDSVAAGVGKPPKNERAGKRWALGRVWGFGVAAALAGDGFPKIAES